MSSPERLKITQVIAVFPPGVTARRAAGLLLCTAVLAYLCAGIAFAQIEDPQWSAPLRVVQLMSVDVNTFPTALADSTGTVHVFWVEKDANNAYSIMYMWKQGAAWSEPRDVLFLPPRVDKFNVTLDSNGLLHAVWAGGSLDDIYHSEARVSAAQDPTAWTAPRRVPIEMHPLDGPSVFWDSDGRCNLVFVDATTQASYYTSSDDGSRTWSKPVLIGKTPAFTRAYDTPWTTSDIKRDGRGRLHVVWTNQISQRGYYARSEDDGKTWTSSLELPSPERSQIVYHISPTITVIGDDEIHLFWLAAYTVRQDGTVPGKERYHAWSRDGGQTWSSMESIFRDVTGHTGPIGAVVDSVGNIHLATVGGYGPAAIHWVEVESWLNGNWSGVSVVPGSRQNGEAMPAANDLAISEGNRLHVVWRTNDGYLWYATREVTAPSVPTQPVAVVTTIPPVVTPTRPAPAAAVSPSPTSPASVEFSASASPASLLDPNSTILPGILSTTAILALVLVVYQVRRRNR